jgi:hypothetical protein
LVVAMQFVERAADLSAALPRAAALAAILVWLWRLHNRSGALARYERTAVHAWFARKELCLVPIAWWVCAAVQWAAFTFALAFLWLAVIEPAVAPSGVAALGLGLMLKFLRSEWRRPWQPDVLGANDIQAAFSGTMRERRIDRLITALGVGVILWPFVQSL